MNFAKQAEAFLGKHRKKDAPKLALLLEKMSERTSSVRFARGL